MSGRILYEQNDYPVFQNRMFPTRDAAPDCRKGTIRLVEDRETVARNEPGAVLEILTRDPPDEVRTLVDPNGTLGQRLTIRPPSSAQMPEALARHKVSAMFFLTGLSKLGSSPTRMGEVLGMGIPVIANEGVGDMGAIVRKFGIGVLLNTPDKADEAYRQMIELRRDPDPPARCRAAAETVFSLARGVAQYRDLYRRILEEDISCAV